MRWLETAKLLLLLYSSLTMNPHIEAHRDKDGEMERKKKQEFQTVEYYSATRHEWSTAASGVLTVIVWTKQTTYKHKASALWGSYLGPSVNSKAQNESIKRALRCSCLFKTCLHYTGPTACLHDCLELHIPPPPPPPATLQQAWSQPRNTKHIHTHTYRA